MELDDALALTSPAGRELLAQLPAYTESQVVALTTKLRDQGYDARLVAAALTQSRLRARAVTKFGVLAHDMLFTPDALEQATRAAVAQRHAQRFVDAGITHVIDGGCGIGADALGFARAGLAVTAIEGDAATAELARHNLALATATSQRAHVEHRFLGDADDATLDLPSGTHEASAWWFDPARRVTGVADINGRTKRTFSLATLSPSWDLLQSLARTTRAAGAKLSPSIAHADVPARTEAEFTSFAGDVVEATIWWGDAVENPGRTATIIKPAHRSGSDVMAVDTLHVTRAEAEGADETLASRATFGAYLYEADKALTRSGLVGSLLRAVEGQELAAGYGYVTSDELLDIGLLGRRYRVLDLVPLHTKTLRGYLRARHVGRLTIKKRDVDVDADTLRRSLKLTGREALTIILATIEGERTAVVVEPA